MPRQNAANRTSQRGSRANARRHAMRLREADAADEEWRINERDAARMYDVDQQRIAPDIDRMHTPDRTATIWLARDTSNPANFYMMCGNSEPAFYWRATGQRLWTIDLAHVPEGVLGTCEVLTEHLPLLSNAEVQRLEDIDYNRGVELLRQLEQPTPDVPEHEPAAAPPSPHSSVHSDPEEGGGDALDVIGALEPTYADLVNSEAPVDVSAPINGFSPEVQAALAAPEQPQRSSIQWIEAVREMQRQNSVLNTQMHAQLNEFTQRASERIMGREGRRGIMIAPQRNRVAPTHSAPVLPAPIPIAPSRSEKEKRDELEQQVARLTWMLAGSIAQTAAAATTTAAEKPDRRRKRTDDRVSDAPERKSKRRESLFIAPAEKDAELACCVCLEDAQSDRLVCKFDRCAHWSCAACASKIKDSCPLCREKINFDRCQYFANARAMAEACNKK